MPHESIFSLLYVSTVSASAAMTLSETMRAILVTSNANNQRDEITGFLLSDGYVYVQILEGSETLVRACFSRICADERNSLPAVRDTGRSSERLFPNWSMCGLNLAGQDNVLLQPGQIGFNLSEASPGALRQHLLALGARYGADLLQAHAQLLRSAAE